MNKLKTQNNLTINLFILLLRLFTEIIKLKNIKINL